MSGRVRRLLVGSFLSVVLLGTTALVFVVAPAGGTLALNHAMLDDGTCGQVLQLGSDITASRSSTPSFLLGGTALSSYSMAIDGVSIGTFNSDQYSHVCVRDTIVFARRCPPADGQGTEAERCEQPLPRSRRPSTRLRRRRRTGSVLISRPSTGVIGDNVTTVTNLRIDGFGTVGAPIYGGLKAR